MNMKSAMAEYGRANIQAEVNTASPHRLIQMLMQGALDKMAIARGALERKDFAKKSENISMAISIIQGLQSSLDKEQGEDIAQNLDDLYQYMIKTLFEANASNDMSKLNEAAKLMAEIKQGWDELGVMLAKQASQSERLYAGV
ncbi:MAG: flagellar export chaperone FliS [Thioalkalispiraceae bacterium]|jgi:flagellar protein FliS